MSGESSSSPEPGRRHLTADESSDGLPRRGGGSPAALRVMSGALSVAQPSMAMDPKERERLFEAALAPESGEVDMEVIRALAFQGVPDVRGLRAKYWRLILGVLPAQVGEWERAAGRLRESYQQFRSELILDPAKFRDRAAPPGQRTEIEVSGEHPLSTSGSSQWNAYFADNDALNEIDKDVKRTFPHLGFFNRALPGEENADHFHAIRRILFLYAKLNPGISYVQGMNEVLAPIYYVMACDPDEAWAAHAEADAFFCFTQVMSEIRDMFCKKVDRTDHGVHSNMARLMALLRHHDPELHADLLDKELDPQFFAFRWLTLLLSQEFELPDVIRIWDPFFADPDRFEFAVYFCCAMMVLVRDELLACDFAGSLKLLQNFPHSTIDVGVIFRAAVELRDADRRRNRAQ